MKWTVLAVVLGLSSITACGPASRGDNFGTSDGGNGSGSGNGSGGDGCSASAKLIFTVDANNTLSQFDPTTKAFTDLGTLTCPAGSGYNPFSMGVDRNAVAYVLYVNQDATTGTVNGTKLFKVDTTSSALTCTATTFNPGNYKEFGMGFSTTMAGGNTDQLFIAGGANVATTAQTNLTTIDVSSYAVGSPHMITGSPELTGNSNAELWGFFPDSSNPKIEQINKATGTADHTYRLTDNAFIGQPLAWAFAFYGGDYYIFLMKDNSGGFNPETSTTVYQVDATGVLKGKTATNTRTIVGAGVSTCAPVVIQ